jgi:hypothetical protein
MPVSHGKQARANREANKRRRAAAAEKQQPLDPKLQAEIAEERRKFKEKQYPRPPVYDQLVSVRGDPTLRGQPQPVFKGAKFKSGVVLSGLPGLEVLMWLFGTSKRKK